MKTNRIFSIIAAAALTISVSAQQSGHDNYVGLSFGGGLNTMLYKAANGDRSVGAGFDAGLHYARFFNSYIGLGVGVNYYYANAYAKYNWLESTPDLVHARNTNITYTLNTRFSDFEERQNIGVLSIPVELLLRKTFNDRVELIGGVGLALDIPVHGKYYAKGGNYSTSGMFPDVGYELVNIPANGFSTYDDTHGAKPENIAKIGGSVIADLGVRTALSDNCGLYLGIYFGYGFSNFIKEEKANPMLLVDTKDPSKIDYRGTFDSNETDKLNLIRCGVKLAIDFGWSDKDKEIAIEPEIAPAPVVDEEAELRRQQQIADSIAAAQAEAERLAREQAVRDSIAAVEAAKAAEAQRIAEFKRRVEEIDVRFEVEKDKVTFKPEDKEIIDELCETMKNDNSVRIVITGHTDNYGDPEQNLRYFGMKRAEALKSFMVDKGVSADQIKCESKGDKEPVAPNDTRANRAKNRRAHISFVE